MLEKFFGEVASTDASKVRPHWQTPFAHVAREAVIDTTLNALAGNDEDLSKAAAVAGYAEASITAATGLPDAGRTALSSALSHVRAAKDAGNDPDLLEIAALLERYLTLFPPPPPPLPANAP